MSSQRTITPNHFIQSERMVTFSETAGHFSVELYLVIYEKKMAILFLS